MVGRLGGNCGICSELGSEGGGNIARLSRDGKTDVGLLPVDKPVLSTLTQSCSSLGTKGLASRLGLGTKPFPGGRTVVWAGRPSSCQPLLSRHHKAPLTTIEPPSGRI